MCVIVNVGKLSKMHAYTQLGINLPHNLNLQFNAPIHTHTHTHTQDTQNTHTETMSLTILFA